MNPIGLARDAAELLRGAVARSVAVPGTVVQANVPIVDVVQVTATGSQLKLSASARIVGETACAPLIEISTDGGPWRTQWSWAAKSGERELVTALLLPVTAGSTVRVRWRANAAMTLLRASLDVEQVPAASPPRGLVTGGSLS